MNFWNDAQAWENEWWGDCLNTYGEQEKQLLYANRMGLRMFHDGKSPYNIDLRGADILDVGGGPTSLLLKCYNLGRHCRVVDPLDLPKWAIARYICAGIDFDQRPAEKMSYRGFDEVWIYNVLQHTHDPESVIHNAQMGGHLIRLFEWIDTPTNEGHPHSLTEETLNGWLNGEGKVEVLKGQAHCFGKCYYGVFPTGN